MKKIILLLLLISLNSFCFSQITLSLLNGRKLNLETYTQYNNEEYIEYKYKKKNGKLKTFYADFYEIYSLNIDGKDSIFYSPEDESSFNVEDMSRVLYGMQTAENYYKQHWWAFASAAIVSGVSLQLPTYGTAKIIIPVGYFAGMVFVRPSKKEIFKKYPQYINDNYFAYGFQRTARKKIIISTSFGLLAGFAISGTVIGIKNLLNK